MNEGFTYNITHLLIFRTSGYNPVEMNASDDRSPEIFKQQLEAATQMKAVLGKNPKPNCLIIDEIDGAPAVCSHNIFELLLLLNNMQKGDKFTLQILQERKKHFDVT